MGLFLFLRTDFWLTLNTAARSSDSIFFAQGILLMEYQFKKNPLQQAGAGRLRVTVIPPNDDGKPMLSTHLKPRAASELPTTRGLKYNK
jgi:hypothetical protein